MGFFSWLSGSSGASSGVYMGHCRKVSEVKTDRRVVSLLFENGPCFAPCEPMRENGEALVFDSILASLDKFSAKGSFAYVGSTQDNYPDDIGEDSEGAKFCHFPSYELDEQGGMFYHHKQIEALVARGHEIVNHSCAHIPFGKGEKGKVYHGDVAAVIEDMAVFNRFVKKNLAQNVKFVLLPCNISEIDGKISAYDVMTLLRMNLVGYSVNCGGREPGEDGYAAEVKAISDAVCKPLKEKGEDALCGKIIHLHDGFNREGRSPVCDALPKILDALSVYGYEVVTVSELVKISPYADIDEDDDCFEDVQYLRARGRAAVFEDNTVRPEKHITRGEAAAMLAPMSEFLERLRALAQDENAVSPFSDVPMSHPYQSAVQWANENTVLQMRSGKFFPDKLLTRVEFDTLIASCGGKTSPHDSDKITRAEFMKYLVKALKKGA